MFWIIISIVVIICLILLSAFFSSAEMAFISINRAVVKEKARDGEKHAIILDRLLQKPENVVSAIVIGNNLVNILASIIAGTIATISFGNIGIGIATVVMILLVIIFGESTPKSFGIRNMRFALRVARPLAFITKVFHPVVLLLTSISNVLIRLIGGKNRSRSIITEREIMAMMRLGEAEGTIERDEREMVKGVFKFDETHVSEVYTPNDKVVFLQENDTIADLIQKSIQTGFSRFPVWRNNLDDIIGMVHVKDSFTVTEKSMPVKSIMRPILKIDSSMKVDDVLRIMKAQKTHLALLQTAEGKTRGLVSMEDVIEEIFGEIADEHDTGSVSLEKK
ncbi:MAG TPA: HlyC/CorC family transporter [Thermoplasmata archaeon]|jgi:putative hemolysin|nr:HlyC/CorC family transporter [Thermoplasmata archaeon]